MDWVQDVKDFHEKFAPHIPAEKPCVPPQRSGQSYCLGFVKEEYDETFRAMEDGDLEGVADGLADLCYVAIRAALIWGIDLRPVWDEVHRANMAKVGGKAREDGKILKPDGWQPPNIRAVLEAQA